MSVQRRGGVRGPSVEDADSQRRVRRRRAAPNDFFHVFGAPVGGVQRQLRRLRLLGREEEAVQVPPRERPARDAFRDE